MKKLLFLTLIICMGLFSSCKEEEEKRPMLLPTDVISLSNAQETVGHEYTLIMKDDAVKQDGNHLSVTYLAEPLGSGDNVSIDLYIQDENHDENSVKNKFEASRNKRSDFIQVEGLGDDAYIAYPTLHLYSNGVYTAITAGSGSNDAQSELLINLGKIAQSNIERHFTVSYSD